MGLTTVLKQKSLQSQPLLVVAESHMPAAADLMVNNEYKLKHRLSVI